MNKPFVIAIDGPAASGKGSLAKRLAAHLEFDFLDTGALYRRAALNIIENGMDIADNSAIINQTERFIPKLHEKYDDSALRNDKVGNLASIIAQIPEIRALLFNFQQEFAKKSNKGAVLDGRDIGTIICPDADLKLFITASTEKRAQRRHKELLLRGLHVKYEAVLAEMQERDERDNVRLKDHLAPNIKNHVIDTSDMSPDEVFQTALDFYTSQSR
ncbi:MAG: (d)CMP kinase [Alphaproteobacteria bacterium]|nr:(d)CMP kinase [Alphaproteobacteria bacterium]NCQ88576.1 (d)CMP kinase [Alphaproteobacteria bacterium]NCT06119.1 (d)CMP kinase [Alphaproteobacteria bacterium]